MKDEVVSNDERYICDYKEHPRLQEKFEALLAFHEHAKERQEFLEKQMEDLTTKKEAIWDAIEEEIDSMGLVEKDTDNQFRFNDFGQVFTQKKEEGSDNPFSAFLKSLS